jgi:hypothetical protein
MQIIQKFISRMNNSVHQIETEISVKAQEYSLSNG